MEGRVVILMKKFYNGRNGSVCNVLIDGNLIVNVSNARTSVKTYNTMDGYIP